MQKIECTCLFISNEHLSYYFLVDTFNKLTSFLNKIIKPYTIMCSTYLTRYLN